MLLWYVFTPVKRYHSLDKFLFKISHTNKILALTVQMVSRSNADLFRRKGKLVGKGGNTSLVVMEPYVRVFKCLVWNLSEPPSPEREKCPFFNLLPLTHPTRSVKYASSLFPWNLLIGYVLRIVTSCAHEYSFEAVYTIDRKHWISDKLF